MRDLLLAVVLVGAAFICIPQIPHKGLRYAAWALYGYVQGLVMTGIWVRDTYIRVQIHKGSILTPFKVLGHECGHGAFSPSPLLNDAVGFMLHSLLLTPYFSWKSSHRRHHIYANHMEKDHNYVPPLFDQYTSSLLFRIDKVEELTEDSPIVTFLRIILQQVTGFPWYLLTNITAAPGSLHRPKSTKPLGNSHFTPRGTLFRPEEAPFILLSDVGLAITAFSLWYASAKFGSAMVALMYLQPYLWVNHWIVAITYLHHTHPELPKFEPEAWTFIKGATATVDRDFGIAGKYLFHGIIEFHVIHHLFSYVTIFYI